MAGRVPVSYTHLSIRNEDATHIMFLVTKELKLRQTKITKNLTSIIAVSYTHLDVYKRQALERDNGSNLEATYSLTITSGKATLYWLSSGEEHIIVYRWL